MTKATIMSILKNISDDYRDYKDVIICTMNVNSTKLFAVRLTKKCGTIYCNDIRIDNTNHVEFTNDGKIIAFLDYSAIDKIELL